MKIAQFMSSTAGRALRAAVGIALIIIGISMDSTAGWILAAIGVVPLLTATLDICLLGRVLGAPLSGKDVRAGR